MNPQPNIAVPTLDENVARFSTFAKADVTTPIGARTLEALHQYITGDAGLDRKTAHVRAVLTEYGKGEAYDNAKKNLPGFTPTGLFEQRKGSAIAKWSGYVCVDVDGVSNAGEVRNQLADLPTCSLAALSASGRGVWALFAVDPIPTNEEQHKAAWQAVTGYLERNTGHKNDQQTKDVPRLRFVAFDPGAALNLDAYPITWAMPALSAPAVAAPQTFDYRGDDSKLFEALRPVAHSVDGEGGLRFSTKFCHQTGTERDDQLKVSLSADKRIMIKCFSHKDDKDGAFDFAGTLDRLKAAAGWQTPNRQTTNKHDVTGRPAVGKDEENGGTGALTTLAMKSADRERVFTSAARSVADEGRLMALYGRFWRHEGQWQPVDDYAVTGQLQDAAKTLHGVHMHNAIASESLSHFAQLTLPAADKAGLILRENRWANVRLDTGKPIEGAVFGNEVVWIEGGQLRRRAVEKEDFILTRRPYKLPELDNRDKLQFWGFLARSFGDRTDEKELFLQYGGRVLLQFMDDQKLLIMKGPGRSGKGTLIRLLERLAGDGQNTSYSGLHELGRRFQSARMQGKCLVTIGDLAARPRSGQKRDDFLEGAALMKAVSGQDAVTIEHKRRDSTSARLPVSFVAATNHAPEFLTSGADAGAWKERMLILRFPHEVPARERVEGIDRKLFEDEGPIIAAWMIKSFLDARARGGYTIPASHDQEMAALVEGAKTLADRFVDECLEFVNGVRTDKKTITERLFSWASGEGLKAGNTDRNNVYRIIREHGCREGKGGKANVPPYFDGIQLR